MHEAGFPISGVGGRGRDALALWFDGGGRPGSDQPRDDERAEAAEDSTDDVEDKADSARADLRQVELGQAAGIAPLMKPMRMLSGIRAMSSVLKLGLAMSCANRG